MMDGQKLPIRKLLRSPSLKRKNKTLPLNERCKLERVLGFTVTNTCSLSVDPSTGTVAYPAGCVVVLYHPKKNRYTHIINRCKKSITCLSFSPDGKYLVTGESGHQPAVRVWDVAEKTQVTEFLGHKFAISCVAFSPSMKYLVSIGNQHDMGVSVYSWRNNIKVASNKVATKVTDIAFNETSSMFVTVGNRHVKFWYMDSSKSRINQTVPLLGRSGILGDQKNNLFCSVACGVGAVADSTYVITQSGLLCEFNQKRLLTKWVELLAPSANSLSMSDDKLFVGCANGMVRTFNAKTMTFIGSLPHPHHLGLDVAGGLDQISSHPSDQTVRYPDTMAVCYDRHNKRLTCIYNDHSMYIWDVQNMAKVGKARSFLYHSGSIWSVEMYPVLEASERSLPGGSFLTCSSDDTIRVWNVDSHMDSSSLYKRNIYSNELLKVFYIDSELTYILQKEYNPAGKTDKTDTGFQDKKGVRSIRISPDGKELASGDRIGNIRIHELSTMEQTNSLEAHDSEVLCLEFCKPQLGVRLLASASRDRLLHIFDRDQEYGLVQTLDDHSAAVTSIRFLESEGEGQLHMVSAGADKSLLFRTAQQDPEFQFVLQRHLVGKTTLYDMDVDPAGKFVATACQDRQIRIYNVKTGKQKKSYSGAVSSEGALLRVALDSTGSYVATSCDKVVSIYDFYSGECMATMMGHSEVITCVKFTNDHKHVVSVAGDGCIFIWRLPFEMTDHMKKREAELGMIRSESHSSEDGFSKKEDLVDTPLKPVPDHMEQNRPSYKFSVGSLPAWAKRQVLQETPTPKAAPLSSLSAAPKGRWAQRAENQGLLVSDLDETTIKFGPQDSLDQRRLTLEESVMGDTALIPTKSQVAIINDDEFNRDEEEEEDEFSSMNVKEGEPTSPRQIGDKVRWTRGSEAFSLAEVGLQESFDEDADVGNDMLEEGDATDDNIIFYPQKDDLPDANANSFRVFEGERAESVDTSSDMADTEEGSDDEDMSSAPTPEAPSTPCEDSPPTPDDDQFIRANFEALEKLDQEDDNRLNNPRLSISSRFLSRTHLQYLRSVSKEQSRDASSSSSVLLKKRSEMAKAVDETRRRLQALGWNIGGGSSGTKADGNQEARQLHSVPEGQAASKPTPNPPQFFPSSLSSHIHKDEAAEMNTSSGHSSPPETKPPTIKPLLHVAGTPERRRWDMVSSASLSDSPRKWRSMVDVAGLSLHTTSPTSRSPARRPLTPSATLPRSPSSPGNYFMIPEARRASSPSPIAMASSTDSKSSRNSAPKSKTLPLKALPSYRQNTESSRSKVSKDTPPGSSTAAKTTNSKTQAKPRKGRLSAGMKSKFKSTPNLAQANEGEPDVGSGPTASRTMEDMSSVSSSMPSTKKKLLSSDSLTSPASSRKSQRRATVGMVSDSFPSKATEGEPFMPPPASSFVPTSKHDAAQQKTNRRTTMPQLTLSQAKDILMNKSCVESSSSSEIDLGVGSSIDSASDTTVSLTKLPKPHKDTSAQPVCKELDASPMDLPERDNPTGTLRSSAFSRVGDGVGTTPHTTHLSSINRTFVVESTGEPDRALTPTHTHHTTTSRELACSASPIKPYIDSSARDSSVNTGPTGRRTLPLEPAPGAVSPVVSPNKGKMGRIEILNSLLTSGSDGTNRQGSPPERLHSSEEASPASPIGKSATLPRSSARSVGTGDRTKHAMDEVHKLQQKAAHMQHQWEKRRASNSPTKAPSSPSPVIPGSHPAQAVNRSNQSQVSNVKETTSNTTVYLSRTIQVKQVPPQHDTGVVKTDLITQNGFHSADTPKPTPTAPAPLKSVADQSCQASISTQCTATSPATCDDVTMVISNLQHSLNSVAAMRDQLTKQGDLESLQELEGGIAKHKQLIDTTLGSPSPRFLAFLQGQSQGKNGDTESETVHVVGQNLTKLFHAFTQEVLDKLDSTNTKAPSYSTS